jgi:hypothetical protein
VQGTPQGIAVYQNGVRINESYGDVVNWDFIPEMSISKLAMVPPRLIRRRHRMSPRRPSATNGK